MRSILFVCMGNICRSPMAEGVARARAAEAGFGADMLFLDSCGTGGWHAGSPPDPRAVAATRHRGVDISDIRARRICAADFNRFDLILAMDAKNMRTLDRMRPAGARAAVRLLLDGVADLPCDEVPDPYYGQLEGFPAVLDLIELGVDNLLAGLELRHYASS